MAAIDARHSRHSRPGGPGPRTRNAGRARDTRDDRDGWNDLDHNEGGLHLTFAGAARMLLVQALGLALISAGVFGVAASAFHNPLDPSWNAATGMAVSHPMGAMGAQAADLLLQLLGWAGPAAGLVMAAGGLALLVRPLRPRRSMAMLRALAGVLFTICFAAAASALPVPAAWPFATGLGGVLGDAVFFAARAPVSMLDSALAGALIAALGLLLSAGFLFFFFDLRPRDLREGAHAAARVWRGACFAWARAEEIVAGLRDLAAARGWLKGARETEDAAGPAWRDADYAGDDDDDDDADWDEADGAVTRPGAPAARARIARPAKTAKASTREAREAQRALPLSRTADFELPRLDFLTRPTPRSNDMDEAALRQNAALLETTLSDFGVKGEIGEVRPGPVVTLYEFEPAPGVKSSRVINLADDVARSMSATACRIAVAPGRNAMGIELPNRKRETVFLRALLASREYDSSRMELPMALGETIGGEPFIADLARMPHLLIAGTTGSGKSVGINSMILSLLYRLTPEQCRFIMIDPKMLELSVYDGIPHLLAPVVTDPKKAVVALKWTVREMENRYRKMSKLGVRNLENFNARVDEALEADEPLTRTVQTGYDRETGEPVYETEEIPAEKMPLIVVVIDEMADLMIVAGKEIEGAVQRLAQMARAAGIHLIMATQRPSTDVITGVIKANFPTRISFSVTSKIDSRVVLGEQGAEQLLGQGDMLYMASGGRLRRLHGPFVSDREVEAITRHLKKQAAPEYLEEITEDDGEDGGGAGMFGDLSDGANAEGDLYDKAVAVVARDRKATTSYIQRRLQIGYNRAATLMERMEEEGVISAPNHAGKREVFVRDPNEI